MDDKTPKTLNGPSRLPKSGQPADSAVVLLHGYGADGSDLMALADLFTHALPNTAFHAPNAPDPCELAPFGRQWFSLAQYDPENIRRNPETMGAMYEAMAEGAERAAPLIDHFLDDVLQKYDIGPDRLAVVGFSQGTMLALHVALRRTAAVAAVVGYSGVLVGADTIEQAAKSRPPVFLSHGTDDDVVPFEALRATESALKRIGIDVTTKVSEGMGHGIDQQAAVLGARFLAQKIAE